MKRLKISRYHALELARLKQRTPLKPVAKKRRDALMFRVGPRTYEAVVARRGIAIERSRKAACSVECKRLILLSPMCRREDRLYVLLHELASAWVWETGEPVNTDGWCDLLAKVAESAMQDLAAQGGVPALMQLKRSGSMFVPAA